MAIIVYPQADAGIHVNCRYQAISLIGYGDQRVASLRTRARNSLSKAEPEPIKSKCISLALLTSGCGPLSASRAFFFKLGFRPYGRQRRARGNLDPSRDDLRKAWGGVHRPSFMPDKIYRMIRVLEVEAEMEETAANRFLESASRLNDSNRRMSLEQAASEVIARAAQLRQRISLLDPTRHRF